MQVQIRNLQRRASGYFFRIGIPKDLQNCYEGKREIVKSLKTKDSNFAVIKAHEIAEVYKRQFHAYRNDEAIEDNSTHISDGIFTQAPPVRTKEVKIPFLSDVLKEMNVARSTKSKTIMSRSSAVRLLIDWFGNFPISEYSRPMMISFRDDGMAKLPPNLYKGDTFS